MNRIRVGDRPRGFRWMGVKILQAAALALILMLGMPARAGDERAVKLRVSPIYPEIAKRMKIGGSVNIEATVDAQGKVTQVKTISGNRLLSVAAEDAVRKWKFTPGSGDSSVNVEVNFAPGQ